MAVDMIFMKILLPGKNHQFQDILKLKKVYAN